MLLPIQSRLNIDIVCFYLNELVLFFPVVI